MKKETNKRKYKRQEILYMAQLKTQFLKGEFLPADQFIALANYMGFDIHGQTLGKLRLVVNTIDNMGNINLRIKRKFKAEALRGCRILALEMHIQLLKRSK